MKPILFSTPMVQAILNSSKTMTRRIIKSKHESGLFRVGKRVTDGQITEITSLDWDESPKDDCTNDIHPKYKVGDILYIREEHYRYGTWNEVPGVKTKGGRQKWEFVPLTDEVRYFDNPPEEFKKGRHHKLAQFPGWYKRLARFMPKAHARNFIQVIDVRAEKLGEIIEQDAVFEGVESFRPVPGDGPAVTMYRDYTGGPWTTNPLESFKSLWRSINGDWNPDQWVFVYSFKQTDKPL